ADFALYGEYVFLSSSNVFCSGCSTVAASFPFPTAYDL
ncbi:MAG: hypothetical protein AVDCRST_MAG01-01-5254, partial [uncultured Rubrobacteraceae bacterium]